MAHKSNYRPNRIRHTTIYTGGQKVPGVRFQGETMVCIMCGKQQTSDPAVESNWRCIEVDKQAYYACPDHFPPDPATADEYRDAYLAVLRTIMG